MATDATLQSIPATRQEASSTAWFWWKETRQLAPLIALLVIVCLLIVVLNVVMGSISHAFAFKLPSEITMLVFPGLFATGAGPLLVGQERSLRTLDWLALLPISARRIATTKFCVALVGLVLMWVFALFMVIAFDLDSTKSSRWTIGLEAGFSSNPFSYPVWICHSILVLLSGFYVSWRIKNQFYSLIALIPLAMSPFVATSLVSEFTLRPELTGELDWYNFGFTLLAIGIVAPLYYRASMRTLLPAAAPSVRPLLGGAGISPAQSTAEAIAPRFGSQIAPIVWQSIHSAKGMLAILSGMFVIGFFASMYLASESHVQGIGRLVVWFLVPLPFAICWLGVSVFKHDGSSERVRFLADRGVSYHKTYFALHAIPTSLLSAALLVYGLWNLTLTHQKNASEFASGLPTLITLIGFVLVIYSVSQWVSQFVRTLILAVILAPILSVVACGWLAFSFASIGTPVYGLILCAVAPLVATFVMMRRYMDNRDRPMTFIVAGLVVAFITVLPVGFAANHVLNIPGMDPKVRGSLLAEATELRNESPEPIHISITGFDGDYDEWHDLDGDDFREVKNYIDSYSLDPLRIVQPLKSASAGNRTFATTDMYHYSLWHQGFTYARFVSRDAKDESGWSRLAPWIEASATLLPSLRRSTLLADQEIADCLEVMMIDTLQKDVPSDRRDDVAVQAAVKSLGTPESRAEARRNAALVSWRYSLSEEETRRYHHLYVAELDPSGLTNWTYPRRFEQMIAAMLEGIEAAKSRSDDQRWLRKLHAIHQTGGVFETSAYGESMRSMDAIETMGVGRSNGFGHLWGRDWEYVDPASFAIAQ